jgi:RNA polymerase sigma-70 factor (ECF subfamily)
VRKPELSAVFARVAKRRAEPGLEALLERLIDAGRKAWPRIAAQPSEFVRHLAERAPPDGDLRALHAADLYLAHACALGDAHAIAAFEAQFLVQVPVYVARVDGSPAFVDEVRQQLRVKLLTGDSTRGPRIADYAGRGPLAGWLRVAALRAARDLKRRERPLAGDRAPELELRSPTPDPELQYLKRRYGDELRQAFEQTLAGLPKQERGVLTLYFLEGMSSREIGALYRTPPSTVRFWIKRARERILAETQRLLRERFGVGSTELRSLMKLAQSQLELDLSALLRAPARD